MCDHSRSGFSQNPDTFILCRVPENTTYFLYESVCGRESVGEVFQLAVDKRHHVKA